jgi:hypothetical protein
MSPETGLHLSQIALAVSIVMGGIAGYGIYVFDKKLDAANESKRDSQHQELTSRLDTIFTNAQLSDAQRADLTRRIERLESSSATVLQEKYDLGYAMLRVTEGNFFYIPRNVQLNVDWMSTQVLALNQNAVRIRLPDFSDANANVGYGNTAGIRRQPGAVLNVMQINNYQMVVECLANTAEDVTLVVGFRTVR